MSTAAVRLLLAAAAGAATLALAIPAPVSAATYTQYVCRLPDGSPAPADGFVAEGTPTVGSETQPSTPYASNTCQNGGALRLYLPNGADNSTAYTSLKWSYSPPPNTTIAGISVDRSLAGLDGDTLMDYSLAGTDDRCGPSNACPGATHYEWQGALPTVSFVLKCSQQYGPCRSTTGTSAGQVDVTGLAVELEDTMPPAFSGPPTGDLFGPGAVHGPTSASFTAHDDGGGVYQSALVVDGVEQQRQVLDGNQGACNPPFVNAIPCPATASGTLALDTTQLSDGPHAISVLVYDATAVNNVIYGPVQVNVDNHSDAALEASGARVPNGLNASGTARIKGTGRFKRLEVRQAYGRPRAVRGRLTDEHDQPIGGAALTVFAVTDVPGATEKQIGRATTDGRGRFSFVVPSGPSRRISIRYRAFSTDAKDSAIWSLRVAVPAPVRLLASKQKLRNRQKLMLTAYLSGAHVPARSADVAFQVLIGSQWRTFATRAIGSKGIARIGHRFRVTYRRLTYRFRVVLLRRRNFPFANASSPVVAVRVN